MAFYLKSKKLDVSAGDPLVVVLNSKDSAEFAIPNGHKVYLCWKDVCLYVSVDISDSLVNSGEIGMFNEVWDKYNIPADDLCSITIPEPPKSEAYIRKKIKGQKLTYEEIHEIMDDISNRRLSTVMMTYFAATSFNPGFDEEEVYYMTKSMAETGDIMDFSEGKPDRKIIDKHSIGGIPSKGVTPILVPIVALFDDVVVPNTASRAITTPAGTSDMLEVVMPVALTKEKIYEVMKKERACLVWGGGFDLAPADDILINLERPLNIESNDKFLVSIIAKKLAMKITHLLIDIPYGDGAKLHSREEAELVTQSFQKLCQKFNIKVDVFTRESLGPDGYGVGPLLEMRDLLRIFERDPLRPMVLEGVAIEMAGRLLELSEVCAPGEGEKLARAKLESGEAAEKFWSIAFAQGATKKVKSDELILAKYTYDVKATKNGVISRIGNKQVVNIARALGAPFIKEAGLYFHKLRGQTVKTGETIVTLYATGKERLDIGTEVLKKEGEFIEIE
ncbi:thymidine phosphorylase [Candidatus Dojkabacteria bacterium]|nr:thymidine phosphorylase [Candidatus Dojkabacteria bacterium]